LKEGASPLNRISREVIIFAGIGAALTFSCILFARQHIMPTSKHHVLANQKSGEMIDKRVCCEKLIIRPIRLK
jgi:hypothetical protein